MRRLVPAVGAILVLGSLALFILLVVPDDEGQPAKSGQAARDDNLPAPVVQPDALRLLQRAAAAPTTASYTGTQFVSAWSSQGATSQVLEVTHTPAAGTTWRSGAHATTSGSAVQTTSHTPDPSILGGGAVTLLSNHYSLSTSGTSHVAGRAVDVVEARRPGAVAGRPPVARFWLDHATGLVLRREVYDGHGDPIRASAFIDVTVRATTTTSSGSASGSDATATSAWSSTMDGAAVNRMRTHGWDCPTSLPGPLPLVDARRGGEDQGIVHLSYADGIASISVFQQRGRLDGTKLRGYRREVMAGSAGTDPGDEQVVWVRAEVPRRVVWSADGKVFTVVADAPERTVDRAVVALHEAAGDGAGGPMDRLGRGLDRVGSWFNPFE